LGLSNVHYIRKIVEKTRATRAQEHKSTHTHTHHTQATGTHTRAQRLKEKILGRGRSEETFIKIGSSPPFSQKSRSKRGVTEGPAIKIRPAGVHRFAGPAASVWSRSGAAFPSGRIFARPREPSPPPAASASSCHYSVSNKKPKLEEEEEEEEEENKSARMCVMC